MGDKVTCKDLITYLQGFDPDDEVGVLIGDQRKGQCYIVKEFIIIEKEPCIGFAIDTDVVINQKKKPEEEYEQIPMTELHE